ncbi:MAG: fatty acid desaturase [Myxococcota bacterium]
MTTPDPREQVTEAARGLAAGGRYSLGRLGLDAILWVGLASVGEASGHPAVVLVCAFLIGAFPLHDVLVHGHEAMHGNASRHAGLNAAVLWATHALVGISGRAHRSFHFDHHRFVGTDRDPEHRIHGAVGGRTTWRGLLRIVALAHLFVNGHVWRGAVTRVTVAQVAVDLLGACALHIALIAALGPRLWLVYGVIPAVTGLPLVAALRAAAEHLSPRVEDLAGTRLYRARRMGQLAWSNVDHHVEHHLAPAVPFHRLPELRERLQPLYRERGIEMDPGLFRTALTVTADALAGGGADRN